MKREGITKDQILYQFPEREKSGQLSREGFAGILESLPAYDYLSRVLGQSGNSRLVLALIKDYQVSNLKYCLRDVSPSTKVIDALLRSLTVQEVLGKRCDGFIDDKRIDRLKEEIQKFELRYLSYLDSFENEWVLEYLDVSTSMSMPDNFRPHYMGDMLFELRKEYSDLPWSSGFFLRRETPFLERRQGEVVISDVLDYYRLQHYNILKMCDVDLKLINIDQALSLLFLEQALIKKILYGQHCTILCDSSADFGKARHKIVISDGMVYLSDRDDSDIVYDTGSMIDIIVEPVIPLT